MPEEQRESTDRTGEHDDKDGAWGGMRDMIEPEEQTDSPAPPPEPPVAQAQRKQDDDLASGEENPG